MLRWFRWSPSLGCIAPGRYLERDVEIQPYLVNALAALRYAPGSIERAALAALRSVEYQLPNAAISVLAIVDGIEISHCITAGEERVAAKIAYYGPEPAIA